MTVAAAVWVVLIVGILAANLPFLSERLFFVGAPRRPKSLGWRLLELLVLYGVTLGVGFALEQRIGQIYPQSWEFFAASLFMFLTLAFPGFVWRYLRRHRPGHE
jgi:RsiW-degrading membrane proteinase PrsW (M82 family)